MNSEHKRTAKGDFISSLVVCLFSIVIFVYALTMPKFKEWGLYATPALAPIAFSIILFICSGIVLIRSIRAHGYQIHVTKDQFISFIKSQIFINFIVASLLVFLFYLFFGVVSFIVVASIYITITVLFHNAMKWWKALILAVVYTGIIYVLFNYVFFIPVP